jgi:MYXO-CTERM domain-containing protein
MARIALAAGLLCSTLVMTHSPDARACGGCFHPPTPPTQNASVITDHRMALAVSPAQTVLWDQVRYSGDPQEFAWVLPVGQAAYIELARDEWLSALDAVSAPTISPPPLPARCGSYGNASGGSGFGCGASSAPNTYYGGSDASINTQFDSGDGVQVVSQNVVGPYLAVHLRSTSGEAITTWLIDNGFEIPQSVQPILDAYTNQGFDFIALKLAPSVGVQAMQPVRIVTPGADPTLPLRMVAAGIGSSVGLTLYVIGEGRYDSANFANATIDPTKILWDPTAVRSNYSDLFAAATSGSSTWVTEYSGPPGTLSQLYKASCLSKPEVAVACADDGGADASPEASVDDAASEASADDAASEASTDDGGADAQASDASDASTCVTYVSACSLFTDWDIATNGLSPYDVRVTRLRTTLPSTALTVDLKLEAASSQATVTQSFTATGYTQPGYDPCPPPPGYQSKAGCGCDTAGQGPAVVSTSLGMIALLSLARRRRRSR